VRRFRYWFWSHVHDWLEKAWHWVYYRKLLPATPKQPSYEPIYYFVDEDEDAKYFRS
jgi:hypothetical protein